MQLRLDAVLLAHLAHVARLPPIEHAESRPGVVELVVDVGVLAERFPLVFVQSKAMRVLAQPGSLGLSQHPVERDERHALLGIAAADVGMSAREPDLLDTPVRLLRLVPQQRRKRMALVVDCQRVARAIDASPETVAGKLEPIERAGT